MRTLFLLLIMSIPITHNCSYAEDEPDPVGNIRNAVFKLEVKRRGQKETSYLTGVQIGPRLAMTAAHGVRPVVEFIRFGPYGKMNFNYAISDQHKDIAIFRTPTADFVADLVPEQKYQEGDAIVIAGHGSSSGYRTMHGNIKNLCRIQDWELIHTDIPIEFGDSGGVILDADGKCIGMVFSRGADDGGLAVGVGLHTINYCLEKIRRKADK